MTLTEKPFTNEEVEAFRKELADIKADAMREELEEIKKERMRKELEEIKRERAAGEASQRKAVYAKAPVRSAMSLPNLIAAALMLLIAGYLIGNVYSIDVAGNVDDVLRGFSLPVAGDVVVAALAVLLAALGIALMTIIRK